MRALNPAMEAVWNVRRGPFLLLLIGIFSLAGCTRSPQKVSTSSQAAGGQQAGPVPIRVDDVELVGMQLGSADGGKTYRVAGQIKNDSEDSSISVVQLKLILQDCLESGDCTVIAQETPTIQVDVPPGQARDFELLPVFKGTRKPQGQINWRYEVIAAKGSPSGQPG